MQDYLNKQNLNQPALWKNREPCVGQVPHKTPVPAFKVLGKQFTTTVGEESKKKSIHLSKFTGEKIKTWTYIISVTAEEILT